MKTSALPFLQILQPSVYQLRMQPALPILEHVRPANEDLLRSYRARKSCLGTAIQFHIQVVYFLYFLSTSIL